MVGAMKYQDILHDYVRHYDCGSCKKPLRHIAATYVACKCGETYVHACGPGTYRMAGIFVDRDGKGDDD